ncbi:hypothetical protein RM844_12930 [Streptomyces sp. DSM 44915]|uniref:Uncharacterized protein n=1 Tax=Streptomyces chisholmiae TaxID=3075540 RepID=A0ABU2JQC4_9ACTN|nr:hypothetical protein [Streptomyces sp. DSM 44915]MDT0267191.1 hypothetical protein [Streptomyces sp. DSM 44915]
MTLVSKGSRRIVVDDTTYRWRVRHKPSYCQSMGWTPLTFAVEHADTPGTILVVTTDQPHPNCWYGRDARPVLPSDVARAIRHARQTGWTPTTPGSPHHLDWSHTFTPGP